jgi:hypothetical protein
MSTNINLHYMLLYGGLLVQLNAKLLYWQVHSSILSNNIRLLYTIIRILLFRTYFKFILLRVLLHMILSIKN